jgi:hypothetical protein
MKWFGESWNAPVNRDVPHAPTPVGQPCLFCPVPIATGDRGYLIPSVDGAYRPAHRDCLMVSVAGPDWQQLPPGTDAEDDACRVGVIHFRSLLVDCSRGWGRAARDANPDDVIPAATMASFYSYTLAAVLGIAAREFGVVVAHRLAVEAVELLANGDFDDANGDLPEPEREPDRELWVGSATDRFGFNLGPTLLSNVHPATACEGRHCVLHNPSDHHMREWPTLFRADLHAMERTCSHGFGHPDPDDLAWHRSQGRKGREAHACDGCCQPGGKAD